MTARITTRAPRAESIVEKIRRGEVSAFVALAEELPEVFRTYVVPKLEGDELFALAEVNWAFHKHVWSEEACNAGHINGTLDPHIRFEGLGSWGGCKWCRHIDNIDNGERRWAEAWEEERLATGWYPGYSENR